MLRILLRGLELLADDSDSDSSDEEVKEGVVQQHQTQATEPYETGQASGTCTAEVGDHAGSDTNSAVSNAHKQVEATLAVAKAIRSDLAKFVSGQNFAQQSAESDESAGLSDQQVTDAWSTSAETTPVRAAQVPNQLVATAPREQTTVVVASTPVETSVTSPSQPGENPVEKAPEMLTGVNGASVPC